MLSIIIIKIYYERLFSVKILIEELGLHNFLGWHSLFWIKFKQSCQEFVEQRIVNQFISCEIIAFFKGLLKWRNSTFWSKNLVLLLQNFSVISSRYSKYSIIYYTSVVKWFDSCFETKPERESADNLEQDASKGPYVEDKCDLREVGYLIIVLLSEFPC